MHNFPNHHGHCSLILTSILKLIKNPTIYPRKISIFGWFKESVSKSSPALNYYKVGFLPIPSLPFFTFSPWQQSNFFIFKDPKYLSQIKSNLRGTLGKLPVVVPWRSKQKTNISINQKQTNKQINIFRS